MAVAVFLSKKISLCYLLLLGFFYYGCSVSIWVRVSQAERRVGTLL